MTRAFLVSPNGRSPPYGLWVSLLSENQSQVEPAFRLCFAFLVGAQSDSPFIAHLLRSGFGPLVSVRRPLASFRLGQW
jgi:hypothetical protein